MMSRAIESLKTRHSGLSGFNNIFSNRGSNITVSFCYDNNPQLRDIFVREGQKAQRISERGRKLKTAYLISKTKSKYLKEYLSFLF